VDRTTSVPGTFETCRWALGMSGVGAQPTCPAATRLLEALLMDIYFIFRQTTVTTAILPFAEKGAGCVL